MKTPTRKKKTVTFRLRMSEQARRDIRQVAAPLDLSDSEFARKVLAEAVVKARKQLLGD